MAETGGVANSLRGLLARAGLARAVTDTIGPVGLGAEASSVASGAAELGVGDDVHVVDTHLCARSEGLGGGSASDDSKEGE